MAIIGDNKQLSFSTQVSHTHIKTIKIAYSQLNPYALPSCAFSDLYQYMVADLRFRDRIASGKLF